MEKDGNFWLQILATIVETSSFTVDCDREKWDAKQDMNCSFCNHLDSLLYPIEM